MFHSYLQRMTVAVGQQAILAVVAAAPDRPHGVDDDPRGQPEPWRRLRLSGLAPTEQSAGMDQLGPRGAVDRAVDAASAQQRGIGGVDDRVYGERRDVGANDRQSGGHNLAFGEKRVSSDAMGELVRRGTCE